VLADQADMADLRVFTTIVRRGNFRKAAIELGVTASALSHRMRKLEQRLQVRLLNRTSRSVVPTQAGADLALKLDDGFRTIHDALSTLDMHRRYPVGRLRLNVPRDAARLLLAEVAPEFCRLYPQIHLDVVVDDRPVDIVGEGYDAGIRYHASVPADMIATTLTPPLRWVIVGAPDLIERLGTPGSPADLVRFPCVQMRVGDNSALPWELGDGDAMVRVDVPGPLCANETELSVLAAMRGAGLAYCLEWRVHDEVRAGRLQIVLPEWASTGPPFAIYYPSRRQPAPGLRQLIELIKARQQPPRAASSRRGNEEQLRSPGV
jgi:DNA-binding transcriptional LysR family regulator